MTLIQILLSYSIQGIVSPFLTISIQQGPQCDQLAAATTLVALPCLSILCHHSPALSTGQKALLPEPGN